MAEVCTPPRRWVDRNGDEWAAFGPNHSLADIARWLMEHPSQAEDVRDMLTDMLNGQPQVYTPKH